jgi:formylmethanofuran:tetrahydromethanopterin formyltransferase
MDGEFLCEEKFGSFEKGSDSNLILFGENRAFTLRAAEAAVAAMRKSGG